jgi:hypothetical protein
LQNQFMVDITFSLLRHGGRSATLSSSSSRFRSVPNL